MKICIFSGMAKKLSLYRIMDIAKEIGYSGIEISSRFHLPMELNFTEMEKIRKRVEDLGLRIVGLYTSHGGFSKLSPEEAEEEIKVIKKYIEFAKILGGEFVKVNAGGPSPDMAEGKHFQKASQALKRVCDIASLYSLKILLEIHGGGLTEMADSSLELLNLVERENLGLIYDAANMYISGTDYGEKSIRQLGKKIMHFHVKDMKKVEEKEPSVLEIKGKFYIHTLLGEGDVDHLPLFKTLKEINYSGYFSCECHKENEIIEKARHEFITVKKLLEKAGWKE